MRAPLLALIAAGLGAYVPDTAPLPTLNDLTFSRASDKNAGSPAGTQLGTISGRSAGSTMAIVSLQRADGTTVADPNSALALNASQTVLLLGLAGNGLAAGTYIASGTETLDGATNSPHVWTAIFTLAVAQLPVGTLSVEKVGAKTLNGVRLAQLQPGAAISGASGPFAVGADGTMTVQRASGTDDLSGGPFNFTVTGDTRYNALTIAVDPGNLWDVWTIQDAENAWAASQLAVGGKGVLREGAKLNEMLATDVNVTGTNWGIRTKAFPAKVFTGAYVNPLAGMDSRDVFLNKDQRAYWTGAFFEWTCRTPNGARWESITSFIDTFGVKFSNIDFVMLAPVTAQVAVPVSNGNAPGFNLLGDGVSNRSGGTGFEANGTWDWAHPESGAVVKGTWTAVSGKLFSVQITEKNAAAFGTVTEPILLSTTKATIGGETTTFGTGKINTSTGVNGFIFILHDQFDKGPLQSGSGTCQTIAKISSLNLGTSTGKVYPGAWSGAIVEHCRFGGKSLEPNRPGLWGKGLNISFANYIAVQDCDFHGLYMGMACSIATEILVSNCAFHQVWNDCSEFFGSTIVMPTSFKQTRVIFVGNAGYDPVTDDRFGNSHPDFAQGGTNADKNGYHIVYVCCYGILIGNIPSQGGYNDDSLVSIFGITIDAYKTIIDVNTQGGMVSFRNTNPNWVNRIDCCIVLRSTARRASADTPAANNTAANDDNMAGTIQVQGPGGGAIIRKCITTEVYESSGSPMASAVISIKGSGYAVGDKIVWTQGFGFFAIATVTAVDANGGILGISWDNGIEPNGIGSANTRTTRVNGTTIKGQIATSTDANGVKTTTFRTFASGAYGAAVTLDANYGDGLALLSDTGSGGVITITAAAALNPIRIRANGTFRKNTNEADIVIENCAFTRQKLAAADANSFENTFVGPFTRVPPSFANGYSGITYPVDYSSMAAFKAKMDEVFTPKAGGPGVGAGHLASAA